MTLARTNGELITQTNMPLYGPQWSQGQQLLWRYARKGDVLTLMLKVAKEGHFDLSAAFTKAPDFGAFKLTAGGQLLKSRLDLYHHGVVHSGAVQLGRVKLKAGENPFEMTILERNPKSYNDFFGLDWIRLVPVSQKDSPE